MLDTKPWYQSKTIVTSLIGAVFAILAVFDILPADLDQEQIVGGVLAVTSVLSAFFRKTAKAEIAPDPKRY